MKNYDLSIIFFNYLDTEMDKRCMNTLKPKI